MDRRGVAVGTAGQKVRRRLPYKPFASDGRVALPKCSDVPCCDNWSNAKGKQHESEQSETKAMQHSTSDCMPQQDPTAVCTNPDLYIFTCYTFIKASVNGSQCQLTNTHPDNTMSMMDKLTTKGV